MHYWVDGYNLLFKIPHTKASLEKRRKGLIVDLDKKAKDFDLNITIVFDAFTKGEILDTRCHYGSLEIIYAPAHQTADEIILQNIEYSTKKEEVCVVSEDKDLTRKARALRSKTLSLREFLSFLYQKEQKSHSLTQECQESPKEIARLLKIFEKKLADET